MHRYLLAVALGVAVTAGCSKGPPKPVDQSPKTVEELAAAAQREIEILTPSLEKAAQDVLADIEPRAAQYEGKCGLVWETEKDHKKKFVAPAELVTPKDHTDGPEKSFDVFVSENGERLVKEWFNTKETYTLTAVEKQYRFMFRRVQRIIHTGQMETPLMGVVEFDVVHANRTASRSQDIPLPIPEHYRLPREGDSRKGVRELEGTPLNEFEVIDWELADDGSYPSLRPFSTSFPQDCPREQLPKKVQAVVDELLETCRSTEPTEHTETQTVEFRYWAAEKRWDWRSDWERARAAELAKQSASDENAADEKPKK